MTPLQIEQQARERYNAIGSTFWSQSEIFSYIYQAEMDIVNETTAIERSYETPTVIGQQEYDFPTNAISVKRITYAGRKLKPINFTDDDQITGFDQDITMTGDPLYYYIWNRVIALRPVPSAVDTLKIWTLNYPDTVSSTTTLELEPFFHTYLIDYVVWKIATKDENITIADHYKNEWKEALLKIKMHRNREKRKDAFNFVRDEEAVNYSNITGIVNETF